MKNLIVFRVDFKLFMYLAIAFIFTTALGTVLHEYGHFIAAEFLGITTKVHYGFTSFVIDENYRNLSKWDRFLITVGGPLQTIFTGILGLILLHISKRNSETQVLNFKSWIYVFMSLFWLRQSANFVMWMIGYLLTNRISTNSDEVKLAVYLKMPLWFFMALGGIVGFAVALLVIFKYIPINQRFTFVVSGFVGGILGYIIWLELLGQILMP
ncbi:hypothetical protein ACFQO9_18790 [Chryseobacterium zhengzhouense]|uniref:Peptidase M50 n=1 Tax=Chryseobacterium zhengzhouense TaxID=1636086 RepID=A0ABW2M7C1_9FLAO